MLHTKQSVFHVIQVYGEANAAEFNFENQIVSAYGWRTMQDVAAWQLQHLTNALANGTSSYTIDTAPHRFIACPEQGQQASQYSDAERAMWICQAFNYSSGVPQIAWFAHNDFQTSGMGDDFGLVPNSVEADLSNGATSVTYQAMAAANPGTWGVDKSNYCCLKYQLGCP